MTVRTVLIKMVEAFSTLPEELLEREMTVREGNEVFTLTGIHLTDSEIKYHTPLLWGRVELELEKEKPVCKFSPVKGWIKPLEKELYGKDCIHSR